MSDDKPIIPSQEVINGQKKAIVWLSAGLAIAVGIAMLLAFIAADYSIRYAQAKEKMETACEMSWSSSEACELGIKLFFD